MTSSVFDDTTKTPFLFVVAFLVDRPIRGARRSRPHAPRAHVSPHTKTMVTDNLRRVRALANHVDPARGVPAHHRPGFTVAVLGAAGGMASP